MLIRTSRRTLASFLTSTAAPFPPARALSTTSSPLAFRSLSSTNRAAQTFANDQMNASKSYPRSTQLYFSSSSTPSGDDIMEAFPSSSSFVGNNVSNAMLALANADAICFDVDSTVITEEGIDVLADSLGKGKEVADFTRQAMGGDMKFEDALAARLGLMEPSKASIEKCLEEHGINLSPGIDRLVEVCHKKGIDVFLVSGGFRIMIEPVAKQLMISKSNIYANTILFEEDEEGTYKGFDATEPTSADGGKPKALNMIKDEFGYQTMIMVGDGATDAQAKPPADAFIGFGGVVVRDKVKDAACWFVNDFEDMIRVVEEFAPNDRRNA